MSRTKNLLGKYRVAKALEPADLMPYDTLDPFDLTFSLKMVDRYRISKTLKTEEERQRYVDLNNEGIF